MLELARSALCNLLEVITFERLISLFEVAAIGAAAYLAYKVGKKQNQINESLLGLHLVPRVAIALDFKEQKIHILNKGTSTVYVWGLHGFGFVDNTEDDPSSIEPDMELNMPMLSMLALAKVRKGNFKESLFTKISAVDGKKYKLKTTIYCDYENDELKNIRAQNHPIESWVE